MSTPNRTNWFLVFIVVILGWTLIKHVDLTNMTLQDPVLDILYLIVLAIAVYLLIKGRNSASS
jgi:nicotinamide riboside transporter PnuC